MKHKISNNLIFLSACFGAAAIMSYAAFVSGIPYLWITVLAVALGILARIVKVIRKAVLEFLNGPSRFCKGRGIEIGSCGRHLVSGSMLVDLITNYSHINPYHVDYIADAHDLPKIASGSLDYVCASHVLEHLANPIRALWEWVRILKPGGIIWLKIPDKRKTFDVTRERTTLKHIIEDFNHDVPADDPTHVDDHNKNSSPPRDQKHPYIHNHVWIPEDILELFDYMKRENAPLKVLAWKENSCKGTQDFWIVVQKS